MNKIVNSAIITGLLAGILVLFGGCYPAEAPAEGSASSPWVMIIFLVVIFGLFYFVMIRPQRKRQKEQQNMQQELHKGDRVITAGGIFGTIESINEESVVLKIESGATIRIIRSSVVGRREK